MARPFSDSRSFGLGSFETSLAGDVNAAFSFNTDGGFSAVDEDFRSLKLDLTSLSLFRFLFRALIAHDVSSRVSLTGL